MFERKEKRKLKENEKEEDGWEEGSWESEWEGRRQLTERKREGGWGGKKKKIEKERREGRSKEIFETSSLPATIIFPLSFFIVPYSFEPNKMKAITVINK